MTALAAFFALIPGALALERGSEANAPLARAILGGLLAGEPATLFVLPCLYSLMVRDQPGDHPRRPRTTAGAGRRPRHRGSMPARELFDQAVPENPCEANRRRGAGDLHP